MSNHVLIDSIIVSTKTFPKLWDVREHIAFFSVHGKTKLHIGFGGWVTRGSEVVIYKDRGTKIKLTAKETRLFIKKLQRLIPKVPERTKESDALVIEEVCKTLLLDA